MASKQQTVDFIVEQLMGAGEITSRKMFGEYAVYCDSKVVAFICDDRFFLKPTDQGRALLREVVEAPPYPGAKNYLEITGDHWDDADYLVEAVRATADALPLPQPRKKKQKR